MPKKLDWKISVKRKELRGGLKKGLVRAIYAAYSKWNRQAYQMILDTAPESKTPSDRFPKDFVKGHIKLVTKRRGGITYQEIDVPGKFSRGSRAWRAWIVIKALHEGWKKLPYPREPTRRKTLGIYWYPGRRVLRPGQKKLAVSRVVQRKQIKLNPWIARVWKRMGPEFKWIFKVEMEKEKRKKVKKKRIK